LPARRSPPEADEGGSLSERTGINPVPTLIINMKQLLLHVCCAPCLSGTHKALEAEDLDITGFFYNPNIHPEEEHKKRIGALISYSSQKDMKALIIENFNMEIFKKEVVGRPDDRCVNCYKLRLKRTAYCAKKNGFDSFSTTLLLSPYQKHELIKQAGEEMAGEHGVRFYYKDFRPFYKDSIAISKMLGLYRQKYCGCYLSRGASRE